MNCLILGWAAMGMEHRIDDRKPVSARGKKEQDTTRQKKPISMQQGRENRTEDESESDLQTAIDF